MTGVAYYSGSAARMWGVIASILRTQDARSKRCVAARPRSAQRPRAGFAFAGLEKHHLSVRIEASAGRAESRPCFPALVGEAACILRRADDAGSRFALDANNES